MNSSRDNRFRQMISGSDTSAGAKLVRAFATASEPVYASLMHIRNGLFDRAIFKSRSLCRPTISVGNITTGGTGKTPVVQWLAQQLKNRGHQPAILLRGYKSTAAGISDEQKLLARTGCPVIADPSRTRGAARALRQHPQSTLFILDDAMQHRWAARDFDLVLISAIEPFGLGRVFPRGLLREPLAGLSRASAFLITHADEVDAQAIKTIETTLTRYNPRAPVFRCDHLVDVDLTGKRYFAFCGIGSPQSFFRATSTKSGTCVGQMALDDHTDFTQPLLLEITHKARSAGAEVLVTTEKDWTKVEPLAASLPLPILRASLSLRFHYDDEDKLLALIQESTRPT